MRMARVSMVFLSGIVLLTASCSDPRCSKANIDAVADSCRVEAAGSPTYGACRRAGLSPPAGYDFSRHEISACNATGAGQVIGCLAGKAKACEAARADGGVEAFDAVLASCETNSVSAGTPARACLTDCNATAAACERACPTATWDACADCSSTCSLQAVACIDKCPAQ